MNNHEVVSLRDAYWLREQLHFQLPPRCQTRRGDVMEHSKNSTSRYSVFQRDAAKCAYFSDNQSSCTFSVLFGVDDRISVFV